ncbi:MAG TPA: DoxX family protein [Ktedonobacterales bacterium]|nr:DoxX family protein [Ktedonobacterales bacterium]
MIPFMLLLLSLLILRGLGAAGVGLFAAWQSDAAYALALMLLLTASVHFTRTKDDLVRMVPSVFPFRRQIVTITGYLELLGAIGLLIPATRLLAGICLALLFIAMFPANVSAALRKASLRGRPATPLWLRVPMQLVFIGVALWAALA